MGILSSIGSAIKSIAGPVISGGLGLLGGQQSDEANTKLQMKFAKNAIQWKTQDALKAGIHPLYALGAPTMSPSASVGATGQALADMGQDIGRAVAAGGTTEDRALRTLQLQRAGLENELIKAQISNMRAGTGPGSPVGANQVVEGQGDTSFIGPQKLRYVLPKNVSPANVAQNVGGEGAETLYMPWLIAETLKGHHAPWAKAYSEGRYGDMIFGEKTWRNYRRLLGLD